jgi:hypothetical protein
MAYDLSGTWKLSVTVGVKSGIATFDLVEAEDGTLSGTYTGQLGSATVSGTVNGDDVEFWFNWHAGKVRFQGACVDGKMRGTCIYGSVGEGEFEGSKLED